MSKPLARLRPALVSVVVVGLLAAVAWSIWRQDAVQDAWWRRADLVTLADRTAAHPEDWRAEYWYGRRLAETGELSQAETALRLALGSQPNHLPALVELGKVTLALNRVDEAFQLLRMAVGRDPKNKEAHLALASLYRSQGSYQRAMDEATQVLNGDPDQVLALFELAACQALLQQPARAEETLRRALRKSPQDVPCLVGLGRVLLQQGKPAEAERLSRQALGLEPNNLEALILAARATALLPPVETHREEALRFLDQARQIDKSRIEIRWLAAQILCDQQRWKDALPELERVTKANPRNTQAYYLLAKTYDRLGRRGAAKKANATFEAKRNYDRQVQLVNEELGVQPDSGALWLKLGDLHRAAGNADLAISAYRSGLQRDPRNETLRERLAGLLRQSLEK